jgi:hypothetical protein
MKLSFDLSDPQGQALTDVARRLQVAPEELAAAAVRDLIALPDPEFEAIAERILTQNAELYRRLA